MVKYTIDTSFAIKGLIPPRRKKQDDIFERQKKLYTLARGCLNKVKNKEAEMYLPAIALVEAGIVVSRITNSEEDARRAVSFLRTKDILKPNGELIKKIWYESLDNEQALDIAVKDLKENYGFYIERFKKWLKDGEEPKQKK